jgi:hypothetical protein
MRLMAHLSGDTKLQAVLTAGGDVFKRMALQWKTNNTSTAATAVIAITATANSTNATVAAAAVVKAGVLCNVCTTAYITLIVQITDFTAVLCIGAAKLQRRLLCAHVTRLLPCCMIDCAFDCTQNAVVPIHICLDDTHHIIYILLSLSHNIECFFAFCCTTFCTETSDVPLSNDDVATDVTPEERAQVTITSYISKRSKFEY